MTAWLLAVMPTRLPATIRSTMAAADVKVLPVPGGPWIGRQLQSRPTHETSRRGNGVLAASSQGIADSHVVDPWWHAEEQVADRPVAPRSVDAVGDAPFGDTRDGVAEHRGTDHVVVHQRGRMPRRGVACPLEDELTRDRIDLDDFAGRHATDTEQQLVALHAPDPAVDRRP